MSTTSPPPVGVTVAPAATRAGARANCTTRRAPPPHSPPPAARRSPAFPAPPTPPLLPPPTPLTLTCRRKHLTVFQRTPSYIHERGNRPTDPEWAKTLTPGWQAARQYAYHNGSANGMLGPGQEDLICDGWTEINRNLRARLDASNTPSPPP